MKANSVTILMIFLFFKPLASASNSKITFQDTTKVEQKSLVLNGQGVRTYLFVDVYQAALYLSEKSKDSKAILGSPEPKVIEMQYFRSIAKSDMEKAWRYSIQENCADQCKAIEPIMNEFISTISSVAEKDTFRYTFFQEELQIQHNNKQSTIKSKEFSTVLLATWIGTKPPTEALKKGLLGLN